MQYLKQLANYIHKKRQELGLSLNQFCIECEIEPSALSRFENGKQNLKIPNLIKIAKRFDMTLGEFLIQFEQNTNQNEI